ncbi:zinc finger and SCAN domain-containing protein 21 isoform X2 [Gadus macrocephalus]|uniref:zinc finger and SCAN domain-containing protein 21 isoform X2 n=1 Tax=Gadus macrocephalus TaxID=80720 RepID=UPI0028CBA377|nr:zinc finger and SCAN domain-containing protein 21 isoform X2 [Gadus macrocephalus]
MDDPETELVSSEPDALGAEFITVELDTQPIEYVVKWAEVGSKFTISCVKKDSDDPNELAPEQLKFETDETFFAPYEEVYPCELTEQSVEIKMDSDSGEEEEEEEDEEGEEEEEEETTAEEEAGSNLLDGEGDGDSYQPYSSMAAATAAAGESRYTCPHCGMSFKGSRMLGSHLRLHGQRRIHPCNVCGKEFNHSSSLSRHRLVHKKDKGGAKDGPHAAHHHRRRRGGGLKAGPGGKGKRGPAAAAGPGARPRGGQGGADGGHAGGGGRRGEVLRLPAVRHDLQDLHHAVQAPGEPRQGPAGQLHARQGEPGRVLLRPQDPPQALLARQAQLLHPLQEEPAPAGGRGPRRQAGPGRGAPPP